MSRLGYREVAQITHVEVGADITFLGVQSGR